MVVCSLIPKTPNIQKVLTLGSKAHKCYLLWAIGSLIVGTMGLQRGGRFWRRGHAFACHFFLIVKGLKERPLNGPLGFIGAS